MARGVRTAFLVAATCFLAVASMAESNSHLQLCCVNYSSLNVLQCERPDQTNCSAAGRHSNLTCYNLTKIKTSCPRSEPASARELHIGAFVPRLSRDDRGFFAGMNLAVALINNRTDLLRNYTLVLHGVDTYSGGGGFAVKAFFELLNTGPKKLMLIGPASSSALEPIGEAAPRWNLLQVSYAAGSPKFGKQIQYPKTFRLVPSSASYSKAKAALIQHFGWTRVAIVYMIDPEYFSPTVEKLQAELKQRNISVIAKEGFDSLGDVSFHMNKLKKLDARIIIGEFNAVGARNVLCQAHKLHMFGSHYAWILFGDVNIKNIITDNSDLLRSCTRDQLQEAMERSISTTRLNLRQDDNRTLSGLTSASFARLARREASFAFDSVWAAALTLNKMLTSGMTYDQLTRLTRPVANALKGHMMHTSFEGVTGSVRFDSKRERQGIVLFKQYRQGEEHEIGQHFTFTDRLEIFESQKDLLWRDGKPPQDRTRKSHDLLVVPLSLIVITWFLASIGIICSLAFLYFNVANRKNRIIKMSSPQLNNLIILGCILCYASVFLFGLNARFLSLRQYGYNCNIRTAVLSVGFSLAFGAMFSKTWRVHKIFTAAKTLKKMAIKDIHLLGVVGMLLSLDLIFLSVWFIVDPLAAKEITFEDKAYRQEEVIIVPAVYQCTCEYKAYFTATLYAYKGLLILFGLFLAWETRNVTIAALNDSRYIGMSVYNVVILATIGAIVSIALESSMQQDIPYAITSLCLLTCTTVTVLLVFVPKIYQFYTRDQERVTTTHIHTAAPTARAHSGRSHFQCGSPVFSAKPLACCTKATQTDADQANPDLHHNGSYELHIDDIQLDESAEDPVSSRSSASLLETRM